MTADSVRIPIDVLNTAARSLLNASRFAEAAGVLDAASGAADEPALAVARAEVTVAADWHRRRTTKPDALRDAQRIVDTRGDAEHGWDLGFLVMRAGYGRQLSSPASREPQPAEALRRQCEELLAGAPDERRRGWAELYSGLIADNVFGQRDGSRARFAAALRAGEEHADDHLIFEALRHLGDHDHDAGDRESTRRAWERSAHHAARAGLVGSTLAQLLLVAVSARDRGDEAGATLLATEIARWAEAIDYEAVRDTAKSFIDGDDPTKEPEDG